MTNETIFYTQIISMVGYIFVVFGLYRIFIRTQAAHIELLNEKVRQLENATPDIVLKQLSKRYEEAKKEIERLTEEKQIDGEKSTTLEELGDMISQLTELRQQTQIRLNQYPMIEKAFSIPSTAKHADVVQKYDEKGTWSPSVQYTTDDSSKKHAQVISVAEAKYTFHHGNVKVFFDFSVDLKKVPSGSALDIGGLPFVVDSQNVYEFKVHQTGLNHSEDLTVSARRGRTWFDLLYVTDGSEGSVRFWGYIVYDYGEEEAHL